VGYGGGLTRNPDYGHIGDHTEVVQVDFDPARLSYNDLLGFFWNNHDPAGWQGSRQYMRAVFYHDERQQALALASKRALERQIQGNMRTRVVPLRTFTLAEDYHQKYLLKSYVELTRELIRIYPREKDLVDSTAAARLNGYAGGYGDAMQLEKEIDGFGLSLMGRNFLESMVRNRTLAN
jgi:peptide-methionine (S)-S-oxide reductase